MLLYNITYLVSHEIHEEWLAWMKSHHAPEILSTGHFSGFTILRLKEVDETEGVTYAFQYQSPSEAAYKEYAAKSAPALRLKAEERWGEKVMAFRTLMEIVQ
jgi:hypothetical protein